MQNTTHYNLKKPDYTDFADIQDINDNMDTIDEKLAAPDGDGRDQTVSFTDADLDTGITSFPTFLSKIVSGMKMAKFLRDFKAGMAYVLHVGSLVNNATCTESGKALDARMGKTLQDQITSLNDSLTEDNLTTSIVMASGVNFTSRRLVKFKHFVWFTMLLPSAPTGVQQICTLPSSARPFITAAISITAVGATDQRGEQQALVGDDGVIYIRREFAASGPISINGSWWTSN